MMPISKKYLHDKLILLLISANVVLAFLCAALIFLRLNIGQGGEGYLIEYRPKLGISAFRNGSITAILSFVAFVALIVLMNIVLSIRIYHIRRELSVVLLAAGVLLLVIATIVSNALLVLH